MSPPLSIASPASWRQRYEELRNHVLEGRRTLGADPLGVVLLCRRRLAGWLRGWQEMTLPRPPLPLPSSEPPFPVTPLWQQELTLLLAQMTTQQLTLS